MIAIRRPWVLPLVVGAALVAGCGSSSSSKSSSTPAPAAAGAPAAASTKVTIVNYKFDPPNISVKRGGTITFTNQDQTEHTGTGTGFDTGSLKRGQSKTVTLKTAGTFTYHCVFHPFMTGTVVVS